ncbi:pseudouridylate synthase PUS7L-like [Glandiceps talaboti]
MSEQPAYTTIGTATANFGIVCMLSDHDRISGKVKERYQDFCVTELDVDGKPVSLLAGIQDETSTCTTTENWQNDNKPDLEKGMEKEETWKRKPEQKWQAKNNTDLNHILSDCLGVFESKDVRSKLHHCVKQLYPHMRTITKRQEGQAGSEVIVSLDPLYLDYRDYLSPQQINNLFQFIDSKEGNTSLHLKVGDCKEKRTAIHRLVAKHFGSMVETKTFVGNFKSKSPDEETSIVVRFRDKFQRKGTKRKFPGGNNQMLEYTAFIMKKEDTETLDAIQKIAMATNTHPSQVSYAGMKDKKAITTQAMVIRNVSPSRLQAASTNRALKNITIGNIQRCSGPLQLGKLGGNHFNIIVRDVKRYDDMCDTSQDGDMQGIISLAVNNLQKRGFVNYYGRQRFGSTESSATADRIGLALLQGNMKAAIDLFFHPDGDNNSVTHSNDPGNHGNNPVNHAKRHWQTSHNAKETLALMPGYKSRECMILKALHRHGQSEEGCSKALMAIPHSMRLLYVHSYCSLVWNHMATHRIQTYGYRVVEGDLVEVKEGSNKKVCHATVEDIKTDRYSIMDVVLPLPGNNITMPAHCIREKYHQFFESDSLKFEQFRIPSLKMNISGDYRKLIALPWNLTWDFVEDKCEVAKDNPSKMEEVLKSDSLDVDIDTDEAEEKNQVNVANYRNERDSLSNKSVTTAIKISFSLRPSSYATVCLREILSYQD